MEPFMLSLYHSLMYHPFLITTYLFPVSPLTSFLYHPLPYAMCHPLPYAMCHPLPYAMYHPLPDHHVLHFLS